MKVYLIRSIFNNKVKDIVAYKIHKESLKNLRFLKKTNIYDKNYYIIPLDIQIDSNLSFKVLNEFKLPDFISFKCFYNLENDEFLITSLLDINKNIEDLKCEKKSFLDESKKVNSMCNKKEDLLL